jgi:CIC family chloride channel protein
MFTAAGSGTAIAAIFNTNLAGLFFALEIILLNDFHTPTFSALILASVSSSAISRILLENESSFYFDSLVICGYETLYWYIILGIIVSISAILFIKILDSSVRLLRAKFTSMDFLNGF